MPSPNTSSPRASVGSEGALRAVLIAPPGAGKGTQGRRMAEHYGVSYLSSGELLRDEVARATPTGTLIVEELERGELVDDSIVSAVVFDNLSQADGGFVLDGFPRTVQQARVTEHWTVDRGLPLDAAVELLVPREELVNRIRRRAVDTPRSDDALRTVLYRLDRYDQESNDLLSFYRERGILITVDGTGDVDEVTERIQNHIDRVLDPSKNNSEAR
ncbi:MAG TPA: adenylate kinase [Acidimicrobiales bacterium]